MLFNSLEFAVFLPVVFMLYWFVFNKSIKLQNFFLIAASYFFYGWWDWRFLSLIAFSSLIDYLVGVGLGKYEKKETRKILLLTSILVNLGFLGFFKYYNFFLENLTSAFTLLGRPLEPSTLRIILPVGISFYTFQTLSYSIDVYRKKLTPTKDPIAFFAFVSFFPQLVAGPIERATNLLPQFYKHRSFTYEQGSEGMRQILWGLFKKVVVADGCAVIVNETFANYDSLPGYQLVLGAIFFAFQIYGDFSGYSDIAIGTARLFGFNLMTNFKYPYFSRDIAEFWRRWHISLSTWFRDYVYIPLGGSRVNDWKKIRNVFVIFLVSGFWHGANWTFIVWGGLNALYFLPLLLTKKNRKNTDDPAEDRFLPSFKEAGQILLTFGITVVAWVFFRAENVGTAFDYIKQTISSFLSHPGQVQFIFTTFFKEAIGYYIILLVAAEWIGRTKEYPLIGMQIKQKPIVRYAVYFTIIALILIQSNPKQDFIYFQF